MKRYLLTSMSISVVCLCLLVGVGIFTRNLRAFEKDRGFAIAEFECAQAKNELDPNQTVESLDKLKTKFFIADTENVKLWICIIMCHLLIIYQLTATFSLLKAEKERARNPQPVKAELSS